MPRIVVSVTNDLVTDQRVYKVCNTLHQMGYEILLIGRRLKKSMPIERNYKTFRMRLIFNKGFLFYAEFNVRLFFTLLFARKNILLSNDLDTLLPNYLVSKLFNKKLVYDSHELFTEIPELTSRPFVRKVWLTIEKYIFPKLKNVYTVNKSIATIYENTYGVKVHVVRNIASRIKNRKIDINFSERIKKAQRMLILQGTGINRHRGAEEAVQMMQYLDDVILYIIGGGDIFVKLKKMIGDLNLTDKVIIKDKIPYTELMEYTKIADMGLSLDKGDNLNYEFSLPNKIFDYIQAQIPILASNRKEVAELILNENIGMVTDDFNPKKLANIIKKSLSDTNRYHLWKANLKKVSGTYCWEKESETVKAIFNNLT